MQFRGETWRAVCLCIPEHKQASLGEAGLGFCVMTPISFPGGEAAAFNCPQT